MEVRYRKERNTAYMILQGTVDCEEYGRRILQENRIEGVMPLSVRTMNGEEEYYFDISDARPLSRVLERRAVSVEEMGQILESLNRVTERMEEYLMDVNHLILDPDLLYLSSRGSEADFEHCLFCCHPAWEKDILAQLRELMQYFLSKMDHRDPDSSERGYELFHATQKEYFRMDELLEICRRVPKPEEPRESAAKNAAAEGEPDRDAGAMMEVRRNPVGKPRGRAEKRVGYALSVLGGTVILVDLWLWLAMGLLGEAAAGILAALGAGITAVGQILHHIPHPEA